MQIETIGSRVLVPAVYAGHEAVTAIAVTGITSSLTCCKVGEFEIDAVAFDLGDNHRQAKLACITEAIFGPSAADDCGVYEAVLGGEEVSIVVPRRVDVQVDDPLDTTKMTLELRELQERALAAYRPRLCRLARLTGMPVVLHLRTLNDTVRAPFPNDGKIHILTNQHPPGLSDTRYISLAYGLRITKLGKSVVSVGPTRGRGVVMQDENGQALVQVLGNTWYILIPVMSEYHSQSKRIFERLLADGLAGMRQYAQRKPEGELDREAFEAREREWIVEFPTRIQKEIESARKRVDGLTKDLTLAIRDLRMFEAFMENASSGPFFQTATGRIPDDYAAIAGDPRIVRMAFVNDGFHFETRPLVLEHEGTGYAIGSFVIRIENTQFSVWGLEPTHPRGIPHPHIDRDGIPCYGNAGLAITQAVADYRLADAVRHILTWLTEGYEPQLARVKIEEWPTYEGIVEDWL